MNGKGVFLAAHFVFLFFFFCNSRFWFPLMQFNPFKLIFRIWNSIKIKIEVKKAIQLLWSSSFLFENRKKKTNFEAFNPKKKLLCQSAMW